MAFYYGVHNVAQAEFTDLSGAKERLGILRIRLGRSKADIQLVLTDVCLRRRSGHDFLTSLAANALAISS